LSTDKTMTSSGEGKRIHDLFRDGLAHIGCTLSPEKIELLCRYVAELRKWNRKINLIARKTGTVDIVERHFLDSLTLAPFLAATGTRGESLLDVGTGAGFPGLVLAVSRPDLQVILVEPRAKRVSFLRHINRCLQLENVEIINGRLEESDILTDRKVDWVTCRALAEPGIFLGMVEPLLQRGTRALLMLGPEQEKRLTSELPHHCFVEIRQEIRLPWSGRPRFLYAVTGTNRTEKR